MSDLVERLRTSAKFGSDNSTGLLNDAADRIEAMEAEVDQLQAKLHCVCGSAVDHSPYEGHMPVSMYDYALDGANTRIEALEAALRRIEKWFGEFPEMDGVSFGAEYGSNGERDYMRSIARAALAGSQDK